MCGISFVIVPAANETERTNGNNSSLRLPWEKILTESLAPRGPDFQGHLHVDLVGGNTLHLLASVLHMRGKDLCAQPAVHPKSGNILLWNGEIFGGRFGSSESNDDVVPTPNIWESDTEAVLEALEQEIQKLDPCDDPSAVSKHVRDVMTSIEGPWAMIYFHRATCSLHFGRDRLGRRSLVMLQDHMKHDGQFMVSSTSWSSAPPSQVTESDDHEGSRLSCWEEVGVAGLWCLDLRSFSKNLPIALSLSPWTSNPPTTTISVSQISTLEEAAEILFLPTLDESVRRRVASAPSPLQARDSSHCLDSPPPARVAVLYSGGIDCQVLAALSHRHVDIEEPLDLINVCFDDKRQSPDRLAALLGVKELRSAYPKRKWRLILVNVSYDEVKEKEARIKQLIQPCFSPMDFNIATAFYFASRGTGILALEEDVNADDETHGGLLRFGGSEMMTTTTQNGNAPPLATPSTLLASSIKPRPDGLMPCPVPGCKRVVKQGCINTMCGTCCIRNQRSKAAVANGNGEAAAEEDKAGGGGGVVVVDERCLCRVHKLIKKPCCPNTTTTSSAAESKSSPAALGGPVQFFQSQARVVLLGIGADEQLAGYGRHRSTYKARGVTALQAELAMDLGRLWTRNLGRDDRCISENGREARTPYLDEGVMALLQALPMHQKFCLDEPFGIGDKKILRHLAKHVLCLPSSSTLVKRAIQFGSRIAREASIKNFGSHKAGKQRRWLKKQQEKQNEGGEDGDEGR